MSKLRPGLFMLVLPVLFFTSFARPSFADSQARIVRLSDVQGDVVIDRNNGKGFEKAFVNLPITQGVRLQTRDDAFAEVEFEDGGTLRLTPNSSVEFTQLSLRDSGAKVSTVDLQEGMAYVNFDGKNLDEFTLNFGRESARLTEPAHFRVEVNADGSGHLAVFEGNVHVESPSGAVEVAKKKEASFEGDTYSIAKLRKDPLDEIDQRQQEYHERYMAKAGNTISPYSYGTSDLYYYGTFFGVPGYGTVWQPYFIGAGWDPFMDGMWMYSAGYGYGWVSSYPWGWIPYHYGQWVFLPQYGWAWQPSGSWLGWSNMPRVANPPRRFQVPAPPPTPGRTVMVRRGPATLARRGSGELVISRGSAGLGIPRGSVQNLGRVSQQVEKHGTVMVRSVPTQTRSWPASGGAAPSLRNAGAPPARFPSSTARPTMGSGGMAPRSAPASRSSAPSRPR